MTGELYQRIEAQSLWERTVLLKRNDFLKRPGTRDTHLYYVVSGSLKVFIPEASEAHILRFGYPHDFLTVLDSFITEQPSDIGIQALKKTELKVLTKARYLEFVNANAENKQLWDMLLQQLLLQQMEREKDILIRSPRERYQRVLQRSPQLFQEIPHKYIALYLRMTPETLSRLKKK